MGLWVGCGLSAALRQCGMLIRARPAAVRTLQTFAAGAAWANLTASNAQETDGANLRAEGGYEVAIG